MGKMTDPGHLRSLLETRDMFCTVPYPNILKIDTSEVSPKEAAQSIIKKFSLARAI